MIPPAAIASSDLKEWSIELFSTLQYCHRYVSLFHRFQNVNAIPCKDCLLLSYDDGQSSSERIKLGEHLDQRSVYQFIANRWCHFSSHPRKVTKRFVPRYQESRVHSSTAYWALMHPVALFEGWSKVISSTRTVPALATCRARSKHAWHNVWLQGRVTGSSNKSKHTIQEK